MTKENLIKENIRTKCINTLYGNELWFKYMTMFIKTCIGNNNEEVNVYSKEDCAWDVCGMLQIEKDKIERCIRNSFRDPNNVESDNSILEQDSLIMQTIGIHEHPSLTINNYTFRGEH